MIVACLEKKKRIWIVAQPVGLQDGSIGEGFTSLSSFLGPLVREHVPYTISDWRKLPLNLKEVLWECIKICSSIVI